MKRVCLIALAMMVAMPPAWAGPGAPTGWFITGSRPADYDFGTEHADGAIGKQSAYIKARPNAAQVGFGSLMQTIKADNYLGQRVRVSARLKSNAVTSLNIWLRVDGSDGKVVGFYNMSDHPVTGTTNWKRFDAVLDVPTSAKTLNYGFFLSGGQGEGWADNFTIEKVGRNVPLSASTAPMALSDTPTNLDFSQ